MNSTQIYFGMSYLIAYGFLRFSLSRSSLQHLFVVGNLEKNNISKYLKSIPQSTPINSTITTQNKTIHLGYRSSSRQSKWQSIKRITCTQAMGSTRQWQQLLIIVFLDLYFSKRNLEDSYKSTIPFFLKEASIIDRFWSTITTVIVNFQMNLTKCLINFRVMMSHIPQNQSQITSAITNMTLIVLRRDLLMRLDKQQLLR